MTGGRGYTQTTEVMASRFDASKHTGGSFQQWLGLRKTSGAGCLPWVVLVYEMRPCIIFQETGGDVHTV